MPPSFLAEMQKVTPAPKRPTDSTPDAPPSKREHRGTGPEALSSAKNQLSTPVDSGDAGDAGASGKAAPSKGTGGSGRSSGRSSGGGGRGTGRSTSASPASGRFFDLSGSNALHGAIFMKLKNATSREKVFGAAKILNLCSATELAAQSESDEHYLQSYTIVVRFVDFEGPLEEAQLTDLCKCLGVNNTSTPDAAPAAAGQ